jgi:hypothetical protein
MKIPYTSGGFSPSFAAETTTRTALVGPAYVSESGPSLTTPPRPGWLKYLIQIGVFSAFAAAAPLPVFNLYGALADSGKTYDPLVDATAYSSTVTYTLGDMVSSGGVYYISEDFQNLGNAVSSATFWYPITGQIMYFDATSGVDSSRAPSSNPATAKAAPFQTLPQATARTTATTGYSLFTAAYGNLILLKRGDSYTGSLFMNSRSAYVACWGSSGSPLPIINFESNNAGVIPNTAGFASPFIDTLRCAGISLNGNNKIAVSLVSGGLGFSVGDTLTGQTTGFTATVTWIQSDTRIDVNNAGGKEFQTSEVLSNGTVTATTASSDAVTLIDGIWCKFSNQRVYNCFVQNWTGNGMTMGFDNTPTGAADNIVIFNSSFTKNCTGGSGGGGIFGGSGSSAQRILQNSFYDNGVTNDIFSHNVYLSHNSAPVSNIGTEFAYNHSYMTANFGSCGVNCHGNCSYNTWHHNLVEYCNTGMSAINGYPAPSVEQFDHFLIYSNIISNIGQRSGQVAGLPLYIARMTNSVVYDNIIINAASVANILDTQVGTSTGGSTDNLLLCQNTWINSPGYRFNSSNPPWAGSVRVENEIYYTTASSSPGAVYLEYPNNITGTWAFKNNLCYTPNFATPVRYLATGPGAGGTLMSIATLNTTTGGALGSNCVITDPTFTGTGLGTLIYQLQSGSPAKGTGATGLGITTDFAGNTFTTPPNMGAYA